MGGGGGVGAQRGELGQGTRYMFWKEHGNFSNGLSKQRVDFMAFKMIFSSVRNYGLDTEVFGWKNPVIAIEEAGVAMGSSMQANQLCSVCLFPWWKSCWWRCLQRKVEGRRPVAMSLSPERPAAGFVALPRAAGWYRPALLRPFHKHLGARWVPAMGCSEGSQLPGFVLSTAGGRASLTGYSFRKRKEPRFVFTTETITGWEECNWSGAQLWDKEMGSCPSETGLFWEKSSSTKTNALLALGNLEFSSFNLQIVLIQ